MSTKVIVLALTFAAATVAGGVAYYYGPELLHRDAGSGEQRAAEAEVRPVPAAEAEIVPSPAADSEVISAPAGEVESAAMDRPAAEAESDAELVAPSFDIIRVEPTGELLAAGRAAPGAAVELLLGSQALDSDESNIDGEWAVIPVTPLPVGEHEIVLRATGANGEGGPIEGDRATVVINGTGDSPVIAIARPGETAQLVQQPEELAAAGQERQPSEPGPSAAGEVAQPAGTTVDGREELADADEPAALRQARPEPDATGVSADIEEEAIEPPQIALRDPAPREDEATAEPVEPPAVSVAPEPMPMPVEPERQAGIAVAGPEEDSALADRPGATPEAAAEADEIAVSGLAVQPHLSVERDDEHAVEVEIVRREAEPAVSRVPDDAGEAAERPALRPAMEEEHLEAPTVAAEQQAPEALSALPDAGDETGQASAQPAAATVDIETVEVTEAGEALFTGRADPGSRVRLYVNDRELDQAVAGENGAWSAAGEMDLPPGRYLARVDIVDGEGAVQASARLRFDRVRIAMTETESDEAEATGTHRAEEPEAPVASGSDHARGAPVEARRAAETQPPASSVAPVEAAGQQEVGEAEAAASRPEVMADDPAAGPQTIETRVSAAPIDEPLPAERSELSLQALPETREAVHIERGDNLWRIARSIYGQGIQYQRIYEANRSQIRNPHLIFPGQVFTIPLPDEPTE